MKAWMGVYIRSSNLGLLASVENMLPHRLDNRLWDTTQYVGARGSDMDGVECVSASLFFNDFNERASFKAALGGINGFIHIALPGSYIKMSKCWHDEIGGYGNPIASDELEYSEVVV